MVRFSPGDVVSGHFGDGEWYLATIEQDNCDGTFTLGWFDGDESNRVKGPDELKLMQFNKELEEYEEVEHEEVEHGDEQTDEVGISNDLPESDVRQDLMPGSEVALEAMQNLAEVENNDPGDSLQVIETPELRTIFVKGMRVEVVDPSPGSKINGQIGTLISEIQAGRWKVDIYDTLGNRRGSWVIRHDLLKEAEKPKAMRVEPPETPYLIVGSWNDWVADPMIWDSERHCMKCSVQIGLEGQEEFQFLLDGDWNKTVHPDMKQAGFHGTHWTLCGPDDQGHHKNWCISGDGVKNIVGAVYEVRLFLLEDESVADVEWAQTEAT